MKSFKDYLCESTEEKYKTGEKYNGLITEIKFLPLSVITRDTSDIETGYEVGTVSDEVAANMDFNEPIEVTAFRYSSDDTDTTPEVKLINGHHRTAAAIQTGRKWLPVEVTARNAKGEKLQGLITLSKGIEKGL